LLAGKLPDPIRVVSTIREYIVCGSNAAEEYRTQPIVVCLTRREGEMNWQAVGVHDRVNLARIMPEKGSSSRCMLVGAAIIRAAFPLTARFIRRLFDWCSRSFENLSIFDVGIRLNWDRPISRFRCCVLNQILCFAC
jgi:hypothetical protein